MIGSGPPAAKVALRVARRTQYTLTAAGAGVGAPRGGSPNRRARSQKRVISGYFWVVLGFLVVAVTKYLTSLRLRGLRERMHREQADANELRHALVQAEERESALKTETDRLHTKVSALRNIVANLERSLGRHSRGSGTIAN